MRTTLQLWPLALVAAGMLGIPAGAARAQDGYGGDGQLPPGVEVLNRGPIHEAFAQPTDVVRQTLTIPRQPPQDVQESPSTRPDDPRAIWISGYWGWDEDRQDFLWISGVWRVPPPGRSWVPGYWNQGNEGWQWVPGFWSSQQEQTAQYLPEPPRDRDEGPDSRQPDENQFWVPGQWRWSDEQGQYQWQAGYWTPVHPGWVWIPACYYWAPSGYVFVQGYWDYPLTGRGVCYAPILFTRPVYQQPRFVYYPTVIIDVRVIVYNFFVRPDYCHYYYGDYYAETYPTRYGIIPWFATSYRGRHYYDPIFAYHRWGPPHREHWGERLDRWYGMMGRHPELRPPHRYAEMNNYVQRVRNDVRIQNVIRQNTNINVNNFINNVDVSKSVRQFRQERDPYVRLAEVSRDQADRIRQSSTQDRELTRRRGELERQEAGRLGPDRGKKPSRVELPRGPGGKPETGPGRKPEGRPETGPGRRPEGKPETGPGRKPEGRPETGPGRGPEGRPETGPGRKPEGRPETGPGRGPGGRPETGPGRKPEGRPETGPGRGPERKPETGPKRGPEGRPETGPGRKPETGPGRGPEGRPEFGPGRKPEGRPETGPGRQPESRPEFGPGRQPERKPDGGPGRRPDGTPDFGPGRSRPDAGPGRMPEGGPGRQPDNRPDFGPGRRPDTGPGRLPEGRQDFGPGRRPDGQPPQGFDRGGNRRGGPGGDPGPKATRPDGRGADRPDRSPPGAGREEPRRDGPRRDRD